MHPPPYATDTVVLRLHRLFPIGQIEQIKSWTPQQVGGQRKKRKGGKTRTISCTTFSLSIFYFIYQSIYLFCYLLKVQAEQARTTARTFNIHFVYLSILFFIYIIIQVQAYHGSHYRPNNAHLYVIGDVEPAEVEVYISPPPYVS
jgi:hypothetical protein